MRRRFVLAGTLGLAACGLSERPYAERRAWPLDVRRPEALPPRRLGRVLLVRAVRAGPGLEARGLQSVQSDGSIRTAFYEEWAAPPAQAVEDALRRWLADSGLFAGVLAPGSRLAADLMLEGELTALWTEPTCLTAHAAVRVTLAGASRIYLQRGFVQDVAIVDSTAPVAAAGMRNALASVFVAIERAYVEMG